jgi:subtilase family serine protease
MLDGVTAILLGLVLATFAHHARATSTEAWVATTTRAHDPRGAPHVAPLKAGTQVKIAVALKLRNKAGLDALTAGLMTGRPGAKPLTPAQFKADYAPTASQVQAVVAYLRSQGFVNIEVADNNLLVSASGGAGSVKNAFNAELHEYDVDGRSAYANVTAASVPAHLGGIVQGVLGLQNVHLARTHAKRMAATEDTSSASIAAVSIPNFAAIYGASSLPSANTATIGIITAGSMTQTIVDLRAFASSAGYPVPPVTTTVVGQPSTDTSEIAEWNMDTQSALGAAGGTIHSMILYDASDLGEVTLGIAYNRAVTDNKAKAINVSLGLCETDAAGIEAAQDQIFQAAVAQGQTFSVSSGDSGAWECGASAGKSQDYPAVSPYVMALGGTTLSTIGGNTWAAESAWNCANASTCQQSSYGGAGGGPSLTESAPSWQTSAGVLGTSTMRGVPDISFDASPGSGAIVLINGQKYRIGGTSLAAPLFTGFWARIQSSYANALPFPAQVLYAGAAANPNWFHDVTSGSQGYPAAVGWDYATGYGSLQVANFAAGFNGVTNGGGGSGPTTTKPTASFTDTVSYLTATFTDTSTDVGGTVRGHAWNFGDNAVATIANPVHVYAAPGTYTVTEIVTDSGGVTASKSASVTVTAPGAPSQILVNGGFETGPAPWVLTSGVLCSNATCAGGLAHAGAAFAWLSGYGVAHTDMATQTVSIPTGKTKASLSFQLHVVTREGNTAMHDRLIVQVISNGGSDHTNLATYSNLNASRIYVLEKVDMSAFIGQTVQLRFIGSEDGALATSFLLDDVALTVQ